MTGKGTRTERAMGNEPPTTGNCQLTTDNG
jgi:hypothetical protein